jgi:hypothetical protein
VKPEKTLARQIGLLKTVGRWYLSPSGLLLAATLLAAGAATMGISGSRWLGLASLMLVAVFVPYRSARERLQTDQDLERRALNRLKPLESLLSDLRERAVTGRDELAQHVDDTHRAIALLEAHLEEIAKAQAIHEAGITEFSSKLIEEADRSDAFSSAIDRLQATARRIISDQERIQQSVLNERTQRIDAFAHAVDQIVRMQPFKEGSNAVPVNSTLDRLRGRRLIFCASSGRSGTHYLAQLIGSADNVHATHEAPPYMIGHHLRAVLEHPLHETYEQRRIKATVIRATLAGMPGNIAYAETNHMFIKTFHDVILNEFDPKGISVVILRRSLDKVLKSMLELGYFTPDNADWPLWMHLPQGSQLVAQTPQPIQELDDIDRAIGYLFDIEARQQAFASEHPDLDIVETRIEEIQTLDGGRGLLEQLRLKPGHRTDAVVGVRTNVRTSSRVRSIDIQECRARIVDYHSQGVEQGIWVPDIDTVMYS